VAVGLGVGFAAGEPAGPAAIESKTPSLGSVEPAVVISVAMDFDCGYCARIAPELQRLVDDFPDTVQLRYRAFPLGNRERGRDLAKLALAAHAQGKFWQVHDAIFASRGTMEPEAASTWGKAFGLDVDAWLAKSTSPEIAAQVDQDLADLEALGVEGTPTLFVNGVAVRGALPYWVLKLVIDDQIRKFAALRDGGMSPADARAELARRAGAKPELLGLGAQGRSS
jgi:protein-disulfide isomerase